MAITSLHDDKEQLAKIAQGNERAFEIVFNHYYDIIFRYSLRLLKEREPAEEIVQEVMLYIWQQGQKLTEIKNLEAYLKTLTKRKAINAFKRRLLEAKVEKELKAGYQEGHQETEQGIVMNEARRILEQGIQLLPLQQRQVYQLCQREGLKYEEAAAKLNISHGTVQTHMKLALKFLRNYIRDNTDLAILIIILKLL
jgi:RNA polymerase sigma-70 factor (family 1)